MTRALGMCTRAYEIDAKASADGRTLEGYVAVFGTRTRIPDHAGDFEEEIHPGFADRSLREAGYPVMQFDHGKDARVGTVPIGVYEEWQPDRKGYFVRGRLFDNPVVEPVRQAIAGRAIKGMSFRFKARKDKWEQRRGDLDLRHVLDADVPEAGPVVFPAYATTSVSVRSVLEAFTPDQRDELIRELRAQAGLATDLNFTGRPTTRSGPGGESDVEPREGDTSPNKARRERALLLRRNPIVLP